MASRLTARDVDELQFAVRADRQALSSDSPRLQAAVEKILAEHINPLDAKLDDAQIKNRRLRRKLRACRDTQLDGSAL